MDKLLELIFFALDKVDRKLADHCRRVAALAGQLAYVSGCDPRFVKKVHVAGLLHDVGFLRMSIDFNEKPMSQMNEAEREYSHQHGEEGVKLLEGLIRSNVILQGIRHHHELYDGSGKPDGLRGEEIPLVARLIVVADFYDTLLVGEMFGAKRKTPADVRTELEKASGVLLDPAITDWLLKLLDQNIVYYAPEGLQRVLLYNMRKLKLGSLNLGNLVSHDGTVLVRQGTELTTHLLDKIMLEFPGQKIIVPATDVSS